MSHGIHCFQSPHILVQFVNHSLPVQSPSGKLNCRYFRSTVCLTSMQAHSTALVGTRCCLGVLVVIACLTSSWIPNYLAVMAPQSHQCIKSQVTTFLNFLLNTTRAPLVF